MFVRKWIRRGMKGIVITILLGLLLFAISPLWMPWVLRSLTVNKGLYYSRYERKGFDQFELHDVTYTNSAFVFHAKSIRSLTPLAIGEKILRRKAITPSEYSVSNWVLEVTEAKTDGPASAPYEKIEQIQELALTARKFISRAGLTNGVIMLGGKQFQVTHLTWSNAVISGIVISTDFKQSFTVEVNNQAPSETGIQGKMDPFGADIRFQISRSAHQAELNGWVKWQTNLMTAGAAFTPNRELPAWGFLEATNLVIPGEVFNLPDYKAFLGGLTASWTNQEFKVSAEANSETMPGVIRAFPASLILKASGDTNQVKVTSLEISSEPLRIYLTSPTAVDFRGKLLSPESAIHFDFNAAKQKVFNAQGLFVGDVRLKPGKSDYPELTYSVRGHAMAYREMEATDLSLDGSLLWPVTEIKHLLVQFGPGSQLEIKAKGNLETQVIESGLVTAEGGFLNSFLPDSVFYRDLQLQSTFSGAVTNFTSTGHFSVRKLYAGPSKELDAKVAWSGGQQGLTNLEMELISGKSTARVQGKASYTTNAVGVVLSHLEIGRDGVNRRLTSRGDTTLRLGLGVHKTVEMSGFDLFGGDSSLQASARIDYPIEGELKVTGQNLEPELLNDFLESVPEDLLVKSVELNAGWTNSPVWFSVASEALIFAESNLTFSASLKATGDEKGIRLNELSVKGNTNEIITGTGLLPMFVDLRGTSVVHFQDGPLSLQLLSTTNETFWAKIEPLIHISLEKPRVEARLGGSWKSPTGSLLFTAAKVDPLLTNNVSDKLPALEMLRGSVQITPTNIFMDKLTLMVEGQPLEAVFRVPFIPGAIELKDKIKPELAEGALKIRNARVGAFARIIPQFLSPQGLVDVNLNLTPGTNVSGYIAMRGVATRPIVPLGAIQEIHGALVFSNHLVHFDNLAASVGGESVVISGQTDLNTLDPTTHIPLFNLTLFGTNLPIVRQTELVLRSDLDLVIEKTNDAPPQIHGRLLLRDSIFLSDIKSLMPGKTASVQKRPPYFSIEQKQLADWGLNVSVRGDQFIKIRSPFFRGVASANLNLTGTLKDPVALGEIRLNSGTFQFPFSSLELSQGLVSLTSDDPFRPKLFVNAGSRAFGYDVKMEVSGNAEEPMIQFSSNPGLASDQIVLMLTAGEVPKDEINFSNQQKASRFGMFLGKSLFSKLTGSDGGSDRLIIRSGENVTESGSETYYVEYKLSDDWSIVGEYDRFNALNAGFKWRFLSR